jgi:hypothetical protein
MINTRKHIYIEGTTIHSPSTDAVYHVSTTEFPQKEVLINFTGSNIKQYYKEIDVATMRFVKPNGEICWISYPEIKFISRKFLPSIIAGCSPVMLVKPPLLYSLTSLDIHDTSIRFSADILSAGMQLLQHAVKKMPGYDPLPNQVFGEYPVFYTEKRPTISFLHDLFHQFMKYNKNNLAEQYNKSSGSCHIRAHLVNMLFDLYGIDTQKVYQLWRREDWKPLSSGNSWHFHCAAIIIDNENHQWVWDPWIGSNKTLLTLKQWTALKASPTPFKIMIANKGVTGDYERGDVSFYFSEKDTATLQAIAATAFPNSPEKPIRLNKMLALTFFNDKKKDKPAEKDMLHYRS